MGSIQGKVVLVTGAAGGIGAAAALLFATEGAAHVALADREVSSGIPVDRRRPMPSM